MPQLNMQQARMSDKAAFFTAEMDPESDTRTGDLVDFDDTYKMFNTPGEARTKTCITGRFG